MRGTLREMSHEADLRHAFSQHIDADDRLEFTKTDLLLDAGWDDAVEGCDYVIHVASPVPVKPPENEDDVIIPARDGTLRLLRAAAKGGVKRVVLTSSMAAIWDGHKDYSRIFDENDWANLDGKINAYGKSKTLAERAAWDFVSNLDGENPIELSTINPGFVFGPIIYSKKVSPTIEAIRKIMAGDYPGAGHIYMLSVDVRDVAAAHLAAMTTPNAVGKRFCCIADGLWLQELHIILNKHFSDRGFKISTRRLPNLLIRFIGLFDDLAKVTVDVLDIEFKASNEQIIRELNWQPRTMEEMLVATGESLIEHNLV